MCSCARICLAILFVTSCLLFTKSALAGYDVAYTGLYEQESTITELYWGTPHTYSTYLGYHSTNRWGHEGDEVYRPACGVASTVRLFDSPLLILVAAIGPTTLENQSKWQWEFDEQGSTSNYVFQWDVKGFAKSSAAICVDSDWPFGHGYGKFESYSHIRLSADTANSDEQPSELRIWAGAEVQNGGGGLSGIGIGAGPDVEIEWQNDPQDHEPSASKQESLFIDGVKSDPGPRCYVKCNVEVLVQSGEFNWLYNGGGHYPTKGSAIANLVEDYEGLILGPPTQ